MGLMDFNLGEIGTLFTDAREAITGKKIEDPMELAKIDLQLQQIQKALISGQLQINMEEAKHPSIFVAGWRPSIGWVGSISLALMFIPKAIVLTFVWVYEVYLTYHPIYVDGVLQVLPALPVFPDLGVGDVIALLGSILGVGAMRSYDKKNGTDTKEVR